MSISPLPFRADLGQYEHQAGALLAEFRSGDAEAVRLIKHRHPHFLRNDIPWLPTDSAESELRGAALELADAQLALARWYDFRDWTALAKYVREVAPDGSPVCRFESAVEAVIAGDAVALELLLRADPGLVRARSTSVTRFDPPVHEATLLHYVAANGVEGYHQRTPKNAVEIATTLLKAGAEVDALAAMYGGRCTTMNMLVSSCHPAEAGVQVALVDTLLDFGAAIDGCGTGKWVSPLLTALAFGYGNAAEALARRGARVDNLPASAGLGRLTDAARLLASADAESRHRALALAAQHGHVDVVRLLLDAGEDPNRYNPDGNHSHSAPLHQAVWARREEVVRLLVERGARLDIKDTIYHGTPLDWAIYGERTAITEYLRALGAPTA